MSKTAQENFLKDLFNVCKKYKVNLEGTAELYKGSELKELNFSVNGAWEINKDSHAVDALELVVPAQWKEHVIMGTRAVKGKKK